MLLYLGLFFHFLFMFFFFQAEDGIRYHCVTGVQTCVFFFSSRRRHTRSLCDWSSDVCSSDLSPCARASRRRPSAPWPSRHAPMATTRCVPTCARRGNCWPMPAGPFRIDRKSTRLNSSHTVISYAVFCLKKKKQRLQRRVI